MTQGSDIERWRRLSALFDRAVDLPASARDEMVKTECADDPAIRRELQAMLDADTADAILDAGASGLVDPALFANRTDTPPDDPRDDLSQHLGPWQLEHVLGRGGMGVVYAAHRDDHDTLQRAAIKRLHRRWDGSLQAQRFLQERRILAALSHPGVPRLIDHGLDGDGRPWFALEYIDGQTLIEWADGQQLDLRARIDLFRQVCAAVQHAHEHFVVHRDLKPGNILVDTDGHPKVLDFGVAKRMDEHASATRTGVFAGFTPEYAAPEQISGGTITAATDVYALGVILYQLLAGCLPLTFDHDDLRATAEAITSRTVARLDQAITTGVPHEVQSRLQQRCVDLKSFRRFVRGDLSRIVQTALAKEPQRRYASVMALADDLKRFLEGRTVSVSGDTFGYRAGKFTRRNRWSVAMAVLAVLALGTGVTGIALQTQEAKAQATRAIAEAARAEKSAALAKQESDRLAAANEFLRSVFASANPVNSGTPNITLEKALDTALAQMDEGGEEAPQPYLWVLLAAADSYEALGRRNKALAAVQRALQLQEKRLPDSKQDRARVLANLAWMRRTEKPAQSLRWAKEAARLAVASSPPGGTVIREAYSVLAGAQLEAGDLAGALISTRASRQAIIDAGERSDNGDVITLYSNEGYILAQLKRYDEALVAMRKGIALRSDTFATDSVIVLLQRLMVANTLHQAGRSREALAEFDAALPSLKRQVGADNDRVQQYTFLRARALIELGRVDEALPSLKSVYSYGREHPEDTNALGFGRGYARALAIANRCSEAAAVLDALQRRKVKHDDTTIYDDPRAGSRCMPAAKG